MEEKKEIVVDEEYFKTNGSMVIMNFANVVGSSRDTSTIGYEIMAYQPDLKTSGSDTLEIWKNIGSNFKLSMINNDKFTTMVLQIFFID